MEWNRLFQLEGTYNDHLVQLPDQFRADQKLKRVIKGIVQMPLNTDRLGASTSALGSPFQCLSKETLPNVQSEPPLSQLETIPTHHVTGSQGEGISTSLSTSSPLEAVKSNEVAPQPPFLQTRQAEIL